MLIAAIIIGISGLYCFLMQQKELLHVEVIDVIVTDKDVGGSHYHIFTKKEHFVTDADTYGDIDIGPATLEVRGIKGSFWTHTRLISGVRGKNGKSTGVEPSQRP